MSLPATTTSTATTLSAFLDHLQLARYQDAFAGVGIATDNEDDLKQLIHFNDDELSEVLAAVHMLPFHSSKLKKALRELRASACDAGSVRPQLDTGEPIPMLPSLEQILSSPTNTPTWLGDTCRRQPSREVIVSHATIYGKRSSRPLTGYEKAINEAAIQLALQDPSLVVNKGNLFERAKRQLLLDGYQYKRGKSRSKLTKEVVPSRARSCTTRASLQHGTCMKRKLHAQRVSETRQKKIHALESELETLLETRSNSDATLDTARRNTLAKEIAKLKAQERKHQWYERRKRERCSSASSSSSSSSSSTASSSEETDDRSDCFFDRPAARIRQLPTPTITTTTDAMSFRRRDTALLPLPPSPPVVQQQHPLDKPFAPTSSIRHYCINDSHPM